MGWDGWFAFAVQLLTSAALVHRGYQWDKERKRRKAAEHLCWGLFRVMRFIGAVAPADAELPFPDPRPGCDCCGPVMVSKGPEAN